MLFDWLFLCLFVCFLLQMEWSYLSPTDTEPTVFPDQGSLSGHRQHGDGTYSLSSHLTVPSSIVPGTKIICTVSHLALDTPLSVSVLVESPQPGNVCLLFVVFIPLYFLVWHFGKQTYSLLLLLFLCLSLYRIILVGSGLPDHHSTFLLPGHEIN